MKKVLTLGMILVGASAMAQNAPTRQTPGANAEPKPNVVVLSQGKTIVQAAADWARAAGATVVVDPTLTGTVTPATAKLSLETGLAAVAKAEHAQWHKAYMKPADIPKTTNGQIDFNKLRAIVELASSVPNVAVGVLDPTTGALSMSTRAAASDARTQEWLKDKTAVYILYRPALVASAAGRTGGDLVTDYLTTQKNSLEAFRSMTPEQRAEASRQGLAMVLDMDPQMMAQMARESMQALQSLTPEQKAKLMDMSMQMMSGGGGGANPAPPAK